MNETDHDKLDREFIERKRRTANHEASAEKVKALLGWIESNPEDDPPPNNFEECEKEHQNIFKWFNAIEIVESCMSMFYVSSLANVKHDGDYLVYRATDYKREASVNFITRCVLIVPNWNEMFIIPESDYDKIPDVPDWTVVELEEDNEREEEHADKTDPCGSGLPGARQLNDETGFGGLL